MRIAITGVKIIEAGRKKLYAVIFLLIILSLQTFAQRSSFLVLGDLHHDQLAENVMKAVEATNMNVPWILAKGNHDITGPGAVEAFQKFYVPMIRKQTNNPEINNASYSYTSGDVQITCLDPWDIMLPSGKNLMTQSVFQTF